MADKENIKNEIKKIVIDLSVEEKTQAIEFIVENKKKTNKQLA